MTRLAIVIAATISIGAALAALAGSGPARATRSGHAVTPCSVLKRRYRRRHRRLPARCRKKPPWVTTLPALGTVAASIAIPGEGHFELGDIAYGAGAVWVQDSSGVARIDPQTNAVVARIPSPPFDDGQITVSDGAVFVAHFTLDSLIRIDPSTNTVAATIPLGAGAAPIGLATTTGALWVGTHHGNTIVRIDPATNNIVATIPTGQPAGTASGPQSMTAGAGSIWTGVPNLDAVLRIDPQTNTIRAKIPVGLGVCGDLAADDTAVWITNSGCYGNAQTRINPATNTIVPTRRLATQMTGAVSVNGNAYLTVDAPRPAIVRIDEATNTATGYLALSSTGFPVDGSSGHTTIVYGAGSLWVRGYHKVIRIQPS